MSENLKHNLSSWGVQINEAACSRLDFYFLKRALT